MRFAVISDVHGNALALDAVLADIAVQGVDATLCLGDHVSGPLDPAGAADRLMQLDGPVIRGNHDRWLVERNREGKDLDPVDRFALMRMKAAHRAWLEAMPATAVFNGEIFLCHGTPASDNAPWLDGWYQDRRMTLPAEESVNRAAAGIDYPVMLCGHTHIARSVRLRDGRQIINPGSVGLQLVHGSPDARYAIVERRNGRWTTDLRVVQYDHHAAAEQAVANGFEPWRDALATGWTHADGLF
ncbi:metallophosphoesterase family protein [Devosia lacusdianchii]|uniref:metallophosphoesterase family protein n=1 Tax=Devosia lacusdianchii TaxID=2917991 RepID=UPI001F053085|nr:metallophosphoesterase family protein [Devosia sp. JXJ CY 41]